MNTSAPPHFSIALLLAILSSFAACTVVEDSSSGGAETASNTDGGDGPQSGANNSDNGDSGDGNSGGQGPSQAETATCRNACNDLQFFNCVDADLHETCWQACEARSSSDIELFAACVSNSNPECTGCLDNFLETAPVPSGQVMQCLSGCNAFVGLGCVPENAPFDSCGALCTQASPTELTVVLACLQGADGCELPAGCELTVEEGSAGGG